MNGEMLVRPSANLAVSQVRSTTPRRSGPWASWSRNRLFALWLSQARKKR
jgi:hypothetical protein